MTKELDIPAWRLRSGRDGGHRTRPPRTFMPAPENLDTRSVLEQFDAEAARIVRVKLTLTFERELERIRTAAPPAARAGG